MKKVLVFSGKPSAREFIKDAMASSTLEVKFAAYTDLAFLIENGQGEVYVYIDGELVSLRDFDKFFLVTKPKMEYRHLWSALGCFMRKNDMHTIDERFLMQDGKLCEAWKLWEAGLSVPNTAYGPVDFLTRVLDEKFGGVGVLKDINGTQGSNNYLVKSADEIQEITEKNPDIQFILQNFIPNDGDYRIVCFDYIAKLGIHRWSNTGDHRNNTSLGGQSSIIEITPEMRSLAEDAARAVGLRFVGVDLIKDKNTDKFYILETNQTPQITSGAETAEKKQLIRDFLEN